MEDCRSSVRSASLPPYSPFPFASSYPRVRCPAPPAQNSIRERWPLHRAAVLAMVPPFQRQRITLLFALCHSARFTDCWLIHSFLLIYSAPLRALFSGQQVTRSDKSLALLYKGVRQTLICVINTLLQPLFIIQSL